MPSEVTFKHEEDILWIINFDETKHKMGTSIKSGIQGMRYHNPSFPRAGDRIVKCNRHITGVYCTNPLEELPPLFIFDTKAKSESNYDIDSAWCQGLPKVSGKYGTGVKQTWDSFVAMRPKGGMDTSLFPIFIQNVILPCYPYVQSETVRVPVTKRKIKGPLIIKTDTEPGQLSKELKHIEFHESLMDNGVHIALGLPNGT